MNRKGTDVAEGIRKIHAEADTNTDGALVLQGILPSSYVVPGNKGGRIYGSEDSRKEPLTLATSHVPGDLYLDQQQVKKLHPHCGIKYTLIIEPIPLDDDTKE